MFAVRVVVVAVWGVAYFFVETTGVELGEEIQDGEARRPRASKGEKETGARSDPSAAGLERFWRHKECDASEEEEKEIGAKARADSALAAAENSR
jgi:hypothetical protein